MTEAARTLAQVPQAIQLRYLQTLADISNDRSSLVVFPLPIDLIQNLAQSRAGGPGGGDDGAAGSN